MGAVEAGEWCRSVLVIGSAGLKGVDITTLPRTSAAFVVELAVLEQPLSLTLPSHLRLSHRLDMEWVHHRWQAPQGRVRLLLPLVDLVLQPLAVNSTEDRPANMPCPLDSVLLLVPTQQWAVDMVGVNLADHLIVGRHKLLSHQPATVLHPPTIKTAASNLAAVHMVGWTAIQTPSHSFPRGLVDYQ
jgi:hypothetical protein